MVDVIPAPPTNDGELNERIRKMCLYVARNGPEFEEKVKLQNAEDASFAFLRDTHSEGYLYYKWHLFVSKHQYSAQQTAEIEASHAVRIGASFTTTGSLDLTQSDRDDFRRLLLENSGRKDTIKVIDQ